MANLYCVSISFDSVPGLFEHAFCHQYYWSVMNLHYCNLKGNSKVWEKKPNLLSVWILIVNESY